MPETGSWEIAREAIQKIRPHLEQYQQQALERMNEASAGSGPIEHFSWSKSECDCKHNSTDVGPLRRKTPHLSTVYLEQECPRCQRAWKFTIRIMLCRACGAVACQTCFDQNERWNSLSDKRKERALLAEARERADRARVDQERMEAKLDRCDENIEFDDYDEYEQYGWRRLNT